jgi:HK97 family phage major capsid protein
MPNMATEKLEELVTEIEAFKERYEKRFDDLEKKANRPGRTAAGEDPSANIVQVKSLIEGFARTGNAELATKAMSISVLTDGGNAVGPEFDAQINRVAQNFSPMRQCARVVRAATGQWQTLVATTTVGAQIVTETAARNDSTTPNFEKVVPPGGALAAVAPITSWLLEDAQYDLYNFILTEIGRSFGITEGNLWVNGTGAAGQPKGILAGAAPTTQADSVRPFATLQYVASGQAATLGTNLDPIITALYTLKPAYRANACFCMHPSTLLAIRQMKDTQSRYLWEPSNVAGQPSTLLGVPVYEDSNMPVVAANALPIIVGDLKAGYVIVDAGTPRLLRDDLTSKGTTKIYYERRVHGSVVDSNAIKVVKVAAA